jgi:CBS domain-containing protein
VDRPPDPKDGCTQGIAKTIPGHVTPSTNDRRKASMKAREVMTDTVHAFTPDTPADIAAQYLHSHGYTAAPVTDEYGNLIGIVTSIDLRTATSPAMRRTRHRRATGALFPSVGDLMITPVGCVTPETDITDIVDMMLDKNIDWLPIVDGHTIVGVITPADLFRAANPPTG